jgi:anti-sigma-K factor RskA
MTCEDFDGLLCDYIDGTLPAATRQIAEVHIGSCAACAELVRDSRFVLEFASRSEEVEPPKELFTKILNQVPQSGLAAQVSNSQSWITRRFREVFSPVLQPRFVMGAMMTLLSLSMLTRCAGPPKHPLTASDLDPVRLWVSLDDKVERTWVRSVKAYESMRLVYEVQSRVSEWKQKQQEDEEESLRLPKAKTLPASESKGENTK